MTVHRNHGEITFECETCEEILDTGSKDFPEAISMLREEGWKARPGLTGYIHYCPKCAKEV